jgi:hypothetical protein
MQAVFALPGQQRQTGFCRPGGVSVDLPTARVAALPAAYVPQGQSAASYPEDPAPEQPGAPIRTVAEVRP